MSRTGDEHKIGDRVAIYKRGKKGLYQADFHYRGQHRRRSLKTSNRKVAVERATKLAVQIQEGTLDLVAASPQRDGVNRTSLTTACQSFIDFKITDGNQPKTYGKYRGTLQAFVAFAAGEQATQVDQVTLSLIDAFRSHRKKQLVRGKKIGPTQMYHDASLLKRFLQWCADRNMTSENPLGNQKFSRPTQRRRPNCTPNLDQVNLILPALPRRIFGPAAVLAFTGMRSANCRQLRVKDVDLVGGWLHVKSLEGARSKCGNDWKAPIHPRLAQALRSLRMPKSGYVFTAPPSRKYPQGGHWINTKHLNDDFVKTVKKLGLPAGRDTGFTIHSLRHFFKSFCLAHGVPREYVDAWQGHASVRSASDLYVHTFDDESQRLILTVPFGDGMPAADAG